jgi:hypothetical protein
MITAPPIQNPGPIIGAGTRDLAHQAGAFPDMAGTITGWFAPLEVTIVRTQIVDGEAVEFPQRTCSTAGILQPMKARALMLKPDGHRAFRWFTLHTALGIDLKPDDLATIRGVIYRVMAVWDWSRAGYMKYELTEGTAARAS